MAGYKPKVISLTKRPGQTFGFFLRVENGEEGHLVRNLEMGGPAELAGMKNGDRILQVNRIFVDGLPHSEVVELVRTSGASVTFHTLDEASYKRAKANGVQLCKINTITTPAATNGVSKQALKPKLCYLIKSSTGYGFSVRSISGEKGTYMIEVFSGSVAERAGVKVNDRLVEVNGENVENATHDQVVEAIQRGGNTVMFLLVDEKTDKSYQKKRAKIGSWLATTKHLPLAPRIIEMSRGSDGYGFLLREDPKKSGHFIRDIDRGSPAYRAGLEDKDRLVAVDGKEVDGGTHEQVVDMVRKSGQNCCLLVVDDKTDQMYKKGKVSPMLFWEENKDSYSPPSYIEAVTLNVPRPTTPVQKSDEELKPKLCRMEKTAAGFGFHLNGIQGLCGQHIREVVKGGAADKAGMENDDMVVEVNGVNVEKSSHEEVVEMIRRSGSSLEMLVAKRSVYEKLKAKDVPITRLLLEEPTYAQVRKTRSSKRETRPDTPPEPERRRASSTSSSSSQDSFDIRF
ncbi:Na(+)/H(+) exchange regulatory cofactor NHE-RF3 [Mugil cephalus]|uniref:Na(+)/H(+) exchange regulatory cofactor NHE-RF3 n=1 Tax=Mugil cephalus TaxID=48193 RepID=UPI001FB58D03|nr:Na(+)/H(+) exchange regulatory cofactor NHE-RF3 [Mugil cephalus]